MPTYEYECKSCGHTFDVFQSMSDEPVKDCPRCGREVRRRINGGGGIIFKGSGFYVTDRKGASASGVASGEASGAPSSPPKTGDSPAKDSGGAGESSAPAKTAAAAPSTPAVKGESPRPAEKKAAG